MLQRELKWRRQDWFSLVVVVGLLFSLAVWTAWLADQNVTVDWAKTTDLAEEPLPRGCKWVTVKTTGWSMRGWKDTSTRMPVCEGLGTPVLVAP